MRLSDEDIKNLRFLVEHFDQEDKEVRESQIQTWKRLKLLWDGYVHTWWDSVAHDWRVHQESGDQEYYDKNINIFKAYLESIIAALSVTVPGIAVYPDDADNTLDLQTAKAAKKIADIIARHNDVSLIWLQGLYTYVTEGLVACYNYSKEDEKFGTYEEKEYEDTTTEETSYSCDECGEGLNDTYCENCNREVQTPNVDTQWLTGTRLVGSTRHPKSRQCMEVYGGLFVKVPNYARKQEDCLYLRFSYETHYAHARARYPDIREKIHENSGGGSDYYEKYGRLSTQYKGITPRNNVTVSCTWLRPDSFEMLNEKDMKKMRALFPEGVRVDFVDDCFAEASAEALDDHWTLTRNPLSDYIHHNPLGLMLTSVQEITGDIISLVLQTIEHGIPQTWADPGVVDFEEYKKAEAAPGTLFAATPKSGKTMNDAFHDTKTATLSQEVLPFFQMIQSLGQTASGALPSLFGGQLEDNKTASGYSMSRAQALQRLQNTWQIFNVWWKNIFGKVIPAYIADLKEDERFVQKTDHGSFINVFIRKAELEGKIGSIELESVANLPMTWMQQKEAFMSIIQLNNPALLQFLMSPENLPKFQEFMGIPDIFIPGENDREKQYDEIVLLLDSEPIVQLPDEMMVMQAQVSGQLPLPFMEHPSVEIDPMLDNHQIEFAVIREWLVSAVGRQAKIDNPKGYKNVLLHARDHYMIINKVNAEQPPQQAQAEPTQPAMEGQNA